jgi:hypothetical protein
MNGNQKYIKMKMEAIIILLFVLPVFALVSCERRPLEDGEIPEPTALIPVCIDWSVSGVSVGEMHRASVWLFPVAGGNPLEYRLEEDLTYREIAVPAGVYSVLVFNETTDREDWETITFAGADRYETFAAMAVPEAARGFYTRSEDFRMVMNPEPLAAWSLASLEVTPEMVIRTREIARGGSDSYRWILRNEVPALASVTPLPRYEQMAVTVRAANLACSMQATGTIDGMAGGVYMASGEKIPVAAAHAFILNGRVYDANGTDGTTTRTFNVFGLLPGADVHRNLNIDFLLTDGTLHPRETFDATDMIETKPYIVATHVINAGFGNLNGDHPVELPDGMSTGVTVDGWDDIIIPIK